jgi:hypothetical protein
MMVFANAHKLGARPVFNVYHCFVLASEPTEQDSIENTNLKCFHHPTVADVVCLSEG